MPLTPEDVRNKQFTTVRLREGYDEDEVDAFLDEVEAELTRLLRENDELRAKLAAATRVAAAGGPSPIERKEGRVPAPAAPPVAAGQGSDGAARVLAMAQQTADQAIAEARNEANKIVTEARAKAEAVERDSRAHAEALERDAADKHRAARGSAAQETPIAQRQ